MKSQTARVTATGVALTLDFTGFNSICHQVAVQIKGVGTAPTSWTAVVQVSLDGTNWSTITTHNATDGSVVTAVWGTYCTQFVRVNVTALTLGTASAIDVTLLCTTERGQ